MVPIVVVSTRIVTPDIALEIQASISNNHSGASNNCQVPWQSRPTQTGKSLAFFPLPRILVATFRKQLWDRQHGGPVYRTHPAIDLKPIEKLGGDRQTGKHAGCKQLNRPGTGKRNKRSARLKPCSVLVEPKCLRYIVIWKIVL